MTSHSDNFVTPHQMREWLEDVRYLDYVFEVIEDNLGWGDEYQETPYLRASYIDRDIVTGKSELQKTRKWRLSLHMTKSEFIQTAFKCAITSSEHRCREHFRYKGSAVFGPHYDVDRLLEVCKSGGFDYRDEHGTTI